MPTRQQPRPGRHSAFSGDELPAICRQSFRYHLLFALLDAAAAGILSNGGIMAVRGLNAEDWHLGLRLSLSSVGMFATLPLGHWMANRPKMPFVTVPGSAFAVCSLAAAFTSHPLRFLFLLGLGSVFEVAARPAVTAVIRTVYPATHRGAVTGEIRKWSSLVFLLSILCSAAALAHWQHRVLLTIRIQMLCAGALSIASFLAFRGMRVRNCENRNPSLGRRAFGTLHETSRILRTDDRFRRYLAGCFLFGFSGLLYAPYVAAFLVRDLSLSYLPASIFLHVIPSVSSFAVTGWIGRRIDRVNPWTAWKWIRLGWALDPLLLVLAATTGQVIPGTLLGLPVAGRLSRGMSMGGSWILWWRIGVNYFARPGADTSRYMGIFTFMNGVMRLLAPLLAAWLLVHCSRSVVLLIGGIGVLVSAFHAGREARREQRLGYPATMADFEQAQKAAWQRE
ncbi:MAG: MFS transporter [Planctomycetota bacterium]|nr:MAG: MFS transporter [Planctomycetota bacterium]